MYRASQQEMILNAERETTTTGSTLGTQSTLVDNAQPMSYTGPPKAAFDSGI